MPQVDATQLGSAQSKVGSGAPPSSASRRITPTLGTVLELVQLLADHAIVNPPETDRVCPVT
jgi:hypothetical protein